MIVAAAHGPIGLERARELKLGPRMNALLGPHLRDMRLAVRVGGGALMGALFFLIVVMMVPFAVGPDLKLLARIGPAMLWLGALLASLLALDRLFADRPRGRLARPPDDGARCRSSWRSPAKAIAHWLTTGLPLVDHRAAARPDAQCRARRHGRVVLTLLAGTPALTFIGLIGAALSVTLRRGGLLLAVLVLPLTIPVLIFGVAAANAAIAGRAGFGPRFHHSLRAVLDQPGARAVRRRGGAATWIE